MTAQNNLALIYRNGDAQDNKEAAKWLLKAAELRNVRVQINIALMYRNVEGVKQDDADALKWFLKAAEKDDARAQCSLTIYSPFQSVIYKNPTLWGLTCINTYDS